MAYTANVMRAVVKNKPNRYLKPKENQNFDLV